jgi:hypothetical protein
MAGAYVDPAPAADRDRTPFTADSRRHLSMYERVGAGTVGA